MKLVYCEQCDKLFWAERSTAKYCSATCRKAYSRGQRKINHYDRLDRHEEIAAVIAEKHPEIWQKLENIRDMRGYRVLRETLEIVELVIKGQK